MKKELITASQPWLIIAAFYSTYGEYVFVLSLTEYQDIKQTNTFTPRFNLKLQLEILGIIERECSGDEHNSECYGSLHYWWCDIDWRWW